MSSDSFFRLIKHTEKLLEEKEEKLCVKILNTLGEMMKVDIEYGEKVIKLCLLHIYSLIVISH